MSRTSWLAFRPRDTVFVRDGRSFNAAADALAETVRPGPTTIAGAVGEAFGKNNPAEVRGPVLAREGARGWEPYFPAPADLVVTTDAAHRVFRLELAELAGQTDLGGPADGGVQRWLTPPARLDAFKALDGWIPGSVLADYLARRLPASNGTVKSELRVAQPLCREPRVGLARDDRSARTGFLYQTTHLRLEENWAFLAEITTGEEWAARLSSHVPFGGRGRLADVSAAVMSWPDVPAEIGKQVLVYLATPAIWPDSWRLPVPDGAELVAAATGDPEPSATVKPGREWARSRALRWAVPAGAVYLLEFRDAGAGAEWARRWHGRAYGRPEEDLLRTAGFGVVLMGAWA
ncbi:MAG: type III-B CRISPR module-associated Cmr3 family protein [Streptosporangiaceae bacterium]